jgi:hypothetical protein
MIMWAAATHQCKYRESVFPQRDPLLAIYCQPNIAGHLLPVNQMMFKLSVRG